MNNFLNASKHFHPFLGAQGPQFPDTFLGPPGSKNRYAFGAQPEIAKWNLQRRGPAAFGVFFWFWGWSFLVICSNRPLCLHMLATKKGMSTPDPSLDLLLRCFGNVSGPYVARSNWRCREVRGHFRSSAINKDDSFHHKFRGPRLGASGSVMP